MANDYDIIILGAGTTAFAGARLAAAAGKRPNSNLRHHIKKPGLSE